MSKTIIVYRVLRYSIMIERINHQSLIEIYSKGSKAKVVGDLCMMLVSALIRFNDLCFISRVRHKH